MPKFEGKSVFDGIYKPTQREKGDETRRVFSGRRVESAYARRENTPLQEGMQFFTGFNKLLAGPGDAVANYPPVRNVLDKLYGYERPEQQHAFPDAAVKFDPQAEVPQRYITMPESWYGQPPTSQAGNILKRTGEEFAYALPYAVMPYMIPRKMALEGAGAVTRAVSELGQTVSRAPLRAGVSEAVAMGGAGMAAGAAENVRTGNQYVDPMIETTAQLIGGILPQAALWTPVALLARGARWGLQRVSPDIQTSRAEEFVARQMQDQVGGRNLQEAVNISEKIPGFRPSLAEATDTPSLVRTQQNIEGAASGLGLNRYTARRAANQAAIDDYGRTQTPEAAGPEVVVDAISGRMTRIRSAVDDQTELVAARRGEVGEIPRLDKKDAGEALRFEISERRRATKKALSTRADELGINDADVSDDFMQFATEMTEALEPRGRFADTSKPEVYHTIKAMACL
jgi:hypothetical protein